jgi:uncharacterized membrane protein YqaE (UPF0057 family)
MKRMFTQLMVVVFTFSVLAAPATSFAVTTPVSAPTTEPEPAVVKAALEEFKSLSRKERKMRVKEAKKTIKQFKANKRAGMAAPSDNTVLLVILAILLPPLAVYLHQGEINTKFWISILLTLLFWLPGVVYALIIILGDQTNSKRVETP